MARGWFVAPVVALAAGIAILGNPISTYASPAPPAGGQQYGWDAPPRELNDIQRRGFHDGVEGARKDFGNNRRPDVNNREEYRNPDQLPSDIPRNMREVWRDGFRRGYAVAASHLWNGAPQSSPYPPPSQYPPQNSYPPPQQPRNPYPPPQQPQTWDQWGMRGLRSEMQQRGYREGMQEAKRDFQWHREPNPEAHEEYQNPYVQPELVDEYREGFMRGYTVTMSQLSGDRDWQQYNGDPGQWRAPDAYSEMERRGFRDGIDGAQKDFGNNRRPDPNNRDEYRSPNVPEQFAKEYRMGFRRGYEIAAARLWGGM